jgi:hypothetical protein
VGAVAVARRHLCTSLMPNLFARLLAKEWAEKNNHWHDSLSGTSTGVCKRSGLCLRSAGIGTPASSPWPVLMLSTTGEMLVNLPINICSYACYASLHCNSAA